MSLQKDIVVLFNPEMKNERVHAFLMGIYPKVNVMEWLKFELAYKNIIVQHVTHYTTGISSILSRTIASANRMM